MVQTHFETYAALRAVVTAYAGQPIIASPEPDRPELAPAASSPGEATWRSPTSYLWAAFLARIYDCFPLTCPRCGNELRLIAFLTEPASVVRILEHLELPATPPPLAPARGPPPDTADQTPHFDLSTPEPVPDFEFDQTVTW